MAISYRDPFEQLQRELESMLEGAFVTGGASALYPSVNLFDAGAAYVVKAELPASSRRTSSSRCRTTPSSCAVSAGSRIRRRTRRITAGSEPKGGSGAWCAFRGRPKVTPRPASGTAC